MPNVLNGADTAWVLLCAALVLFMTPGLAFFYAGQVSSRNTLAMLQQNFIPLGVVSIAWILLGYTIAFGDDAGTGLVGNLKLFGLVQAGTTPAPAPAFHVVAPGVTIPTLAFVTFQMMFAIITPALITGATAGRLRLIGWAVFIAIWSVIVYAPIAHWLWHPGGWLAGLGAQDWAGGMVVHTSAGAAVLAMLIVIGRRRNWPKLGTLPNSLPLTIVGAGVLWFGWFGFNAGDGLRADMVAAQAMINTHVAAAAGLVVWLIAERLRSGHATVLGGASGAVAGLATITPCAGYVSTLSSLAIGAIAGLVCCLALRVKFRLGFDDALDVVAVHFVGGVLGSLLLGFFGQRSANSLGANGLFFGGGGGLLGRQVVAVLAVAAFSFGLTWLIAVAVERTVGLRVPPADEGRLDRVQQAVEAYHLDAISGLPGSGGPEARPAAAPTREVPRPVPEAPGSATSLVTGLLDPERVHTDELEDALSRAGASSVVVTEAHAAVETPQAQTVRGYRRNLELASRLRVEVLVAERGVGAVLDVFDRFSAEHPEGFVQVVRPNASIQR
ncbi:ammonium transporter [Dactylosporangium roseum]|uniref:Ammonium transporter n=1 Tax=Dactylosporangium roseum TaxID=47989 RepID=A0ABY5YWV4_9ACTN|nr:ammonium transporter [Dactylosporangium roseum]UWZ34238.1 ammonium transporter [Dactylosporangium roseum]